MYGEYVDPALATTEDTQNAPGQLAWGVVLGLYACGGC